MLAELFEELRGKPGDFLQAAKGGDFEERIKVKLDRIGYNRIQPQDLDDGERKALKGGVEMDSLAFANPASYRKHYLKEPYGSQQYPDFLVLDGDRVVLIEVKFSKKRQGHPMWNGGLPRQGGLYIFAAYERRDAPFFLGRDVVLPEEASKLHEFFKKLTVLQEAFNQELMTGQRYGFCVYSRKAFDQRKKHNPDAVLDFFENPDRLNLEDSALTFLRSNRTNNASPRRP